MEYREQPIRINPEAKEKQNKTMSFYLFAEEDLL